MTADRPPTRGDEAFWREYLTRGDAMETRARRVLRLLPHGPRCKLCAAPFAGAAAPLMRVIGKRPALKNPKVCSSCFDFMEKHHGGAEIDGSYFFADIRGSTTLAERMPAADYRALIDRFLTTASQVVYDNDGLIDKFVGDEIVAFFFPLMSGPRYPEAAVRYGRVVGFDDSTVTAAALLGLGEARFRMGEDGAALASWKAVLQVGETPSSYPAWRNIAAANVREGDLQAAIRPEIANRLGWLTKETGDVNGARRYFARGRGDTQVLSVTTVLIAATVIVSLSAILSAEGQVLYEAFQLDKQAVAAGEYWRLFTVTLLHGSPETGFFAPSRPCWTASRHWSRRSSGS